MRFKCEEKARRPSLLGGVQKQSSLARQKRTTYNKRPWSHGMWDLGRFYIFPVDRFLNGTPLADSGFF